MHMNLIGVLLVRVPVLPTPHKLPNKISGKGMVIHETSIGSSSFHFLTMLEVRN